jgi:DNA-binding beta-propeller fold protein YncE
VINTAKVGGEGNFDYVYADADGRKLYVPRADRVTVFDLDSLKPLGEIPGARGARGAAVDPASHHGFCSSSPVVMWDTESLKTLKTIDVQGAPDGIAFDAATGRVFVFSHRAPNATVIDAKDGRVVGTIDLGGAPEQAASDGNGRLYVAIEDKDNVAVVDAESLKVTAHYDLAGKGGGPAGLALDRKNHVLFATCRKPQMMVVLDANDGKVIAALPIGAGSDGALFNPATMEAFSSQRDGTLTVVKETGPTEFAVEQNVQTKAGAKTCTLDPKTNHVLLITADRAPSPNAGGRGQIVPGSFTILVVGK